MSKEKMAELMTRARNRRAKISYLLNAPQPKSWSALMPAYAYTCCCIDPLYRSEQNVSRVKRKNS